MTSSQCDVEVVAVEGEAVRLPAGPPAKTLVSSATPSLFRLGMTKTLPSRVEETKRSPFGEIAMIRRRGRGQRGLFHACGSGESVVLRVHPASSVNCLGT